MAPVFRHVLLATDMSEASRPALERALDFAREGAALDVVHVCELPPYADTGPTAFDFVTPIADVAQARLDEFLAPLYAACPGAKGAIRLGVAWEQILAAAADVGADLVVVGTHGRRGVAHALLGSVAERVVQLSAVPVLAVPSRAAPPGGAGRV